MNTAVITVISVVSVSLGMALAWLVYRECVRDDERTWRDDLLRICPSWCDCLRASDRYKPGKEKKLKPMVAPPSSRVSASLLVPLCI